MPDTNKTDSDRDLRLILGSSVLGGGVGAGIGWYAHKLWEYIANGIHIYHSPGAAPFKELNAFIQGVQEFVTTHSLQEPFAKALQGGAENFAHFTAQHPELQAITLEMAKNIQNIATSHLGQQVALLAPHIKV